MYLKYPCAKHTRFEHCIGTAELAKRCLAKLKENNAATWELLEITEKDELCVTLGKGTILHCLSLYWKNFLKIKKTPVLASKMLVGKNQSVKTNQD